MSTDWRPVVGYEGIYDVSIDGRVRSRARRYETRPGVFANRSARMLQPQWTTDGYLIAFLSRDGSKRELRVHRLVLEAFVGPCPEGMEGCHNDGDKTNNHVSNLRWDTRSANTHDKVRHGAHPQARKTHCPQGHAYDETNTYWIKRGGRACRTCTNDRKRARRAALRSAA